jgi:hypothetical protein
VRVDCIRARVAMVPKDVEHIDPSAWMWTAGMSPARGCYTLKKIASAESFAAGITPWQLFGETLEFDLFHPAALDERFWAARKRPRTGSA